MLASLIILNYNTPELTKKCLNSIVRFINSNQYEIIVVDNCSSQKKLEILKSELTNFPKTQLILSPINKGFGGGCMLGALHAKGEYICFINSDVEFIEDCITPLCSYLNTDATIGCITPQQLNCHYSPKPSFDHGPSIKKEFFGKKILELLNPKKYPKRKIYTYQKPLEVIHVFGAIMLFPTHVFFKVGGFDETLFLYYEEYDICTRLLKSGYKSVLLPNYSYLHIHGATTSRNDESQIRSAKELYKSKLYTYKKHHYMAFYFFYFFIVYVKLIFSPKRWYILSNIKY